MSRKEQPAQESSMAETSYSDDERKLVAFVEQVTGGRVTAMRRQPRWRPAWFVVVERDGLLLPIHIRGDRKRSEEHTSELHSLMRISYAVFCLNKTLNTYINTV